MPEGDPAIWNKAVETCNLRHVSHIEPAYVESQEHVMDKSLRRATAACLDNKGVSLTGKERNVTDFAIAAGEKPSLSMQCVLKSARELFPELPAEVRIRW